MARTEEEAFEKVLSNDDFFHVVLFEDNFDDWTLAKEFAEYLIKYAPDLLPARLMLARAMRHLGDVEGALRQLAICRSLTTNTEDLGAEKALLPVMDKETLLLDERK